MIAMLPSPIVAEMPDLIGLLVPIPVPGFPLHLGWNRRQTKDRGLRHVGEPLAGLLK